MGNWSQGCVRSPPLGCQVNQTGDGFLSIPNIKWPDFSYWPSTVQDENGCMNACLSNCSCGAYVYMTTIGCLLWGSDLIDMYQFQSGGYTLNLKLPASELRKWWWLSNTSTQQCTYALPYLLAWKIWCLWWLQLHSIIRLTSCSLENSHNSVCSGAICFASLPLPVVEAWEEYQR